MADVNRVDFNLCKKSLFTQKLREEHCKSFYPHSELIELINLQENRVDYRNPLGWKISIFPGLKMFVRASEGLSRSLFKYFYKKFSSALFRISTLCVDCVYSAKSLHQFSFSWGDKIVFRSINFLLVQITCYKYVPRRGGEAFPQCFWYASFKRDLLISFM